MLQLFRPKQVKLPQRDLAEIRRVTKILFIDDSKFEIVDHLNTCGWIQTKRVRDVEDINHPSVSETHIFFVDIQGVGKKMGFTDDGLGLARALKETYTEKSVILYSAQPNGDRFDKTLSIVDDTIRKNADLYEFQKLVEKYSVRAFSLEGCVHRIQQYLKSELGASIDQDKIQKHVHKLYKNKHELDVDKVSKVFSVSKNLAGTVYYIIRTYFLLP